MICLDFRTFQGHEQLGNSSSSTRLFFPVLPTNSQLAQQLHPGLPPQRSTIALPLVDILLHLEVEVGASQVGPGSEELEDILLLHLQDIETSGHRGVSLKKRRQGTCRHNHPAQRLTWRAPRPPSCPRRRPTLLSPLAPPRKLGPLREARIEHPLRAINASRCVHRHQPLNRPAEAVTHADNAVWRPRRAPNEKESLCRVTSIYSLPTANGSVAFTGKGGAPGVAKEVGS